MQFSGMNRRKREAQIIYQRAKRHFIIAALLFVLLCICIIIAIIFSGALEHKTDGSRVANFDMRHRNA